MVCLSCCSVALFDTKPGTEMSPDVLVTGLPSDVTVEDLVEHFGMVADVKVSLFLARNVTGA